MNREPFEYGGYYHIYNRGVDHRHIFSDAYDIERFKKCLSLFNSVEPIQSLYVLSFEKGQDDHKKIKPFVELVAYCLNPNHYHLILRQQGGGGIAEFMKRLNGGYTWYFNNKVKRTGALFQGRFKSKYVDGNDYLLRLSAYVNLNDRVHQLSGSTAKLVRSCWEEYNQTKNSGICSSSIILEQFKDRNGYRKFALEALPQLIQQKENQKELKQLLLE